MLACDAGLSAVMQPAPEETGMTLNTVDTEPAYQIASVGRALTLLSAFSQRHQLTVSEAAELLGVAPSTAHRLLQMLIHHGYAVQGDRRVYVRGPAMQALASGSSRGEDLQAIAIPRLTLLRDALRGTASLLTLEGNGARFLACAEWRDRSEIAVSRVGWLLPAHVLAAGKAMLASLSTAKIDALYPDGVPITRFGRVYSMAQLHRELRDVRSRGYARSREAHENVHSLGVALPTGAGSPTMAVSIAWDAARFPAGQEQEGMQLMRSTARELADAVKSSA
jgi:DNA-binding IclR family transcriptional regulator